MSFYIKGGLIKPYQTLQGNILKILFFLHIDCDLYSSTKVVFDFLKNQIVKGTVIVFDEYFNYPGWQNGEFKAFKEFVIQNNVEYEYLTYNRYHEQVAVIIKNIR